MIKAITVVKKAIPLSVKKKLHRLRRLVPKKLALGWTLNSGLQIVITSESDWVIYNDIFVNGEYDQAIADVLDSAPRNGKINVLDIGANVGFFVLRFLHLRQQKGRDDIVPRITAVEGSPAVHAELVRRLHRDNRLEQVRIVHGLAGERSGTAKIAEGDFHAMNSLFFDKTADTVDVDFVNLDTLFDGEEVIDLLKCDIEGAELRFIENYSDLLQRTKSAVFELHHNRCDTEECRRILARLGFTVQIELRVAPTITVCQFSKQAG